jgi:hypothetical protein
MNIKQLSVVLENTAGKLHEMTTLLYEADIDIRSIWVSEETEFSAVHVIVDKPLVAFDALKQRGYFVKMVDVFALKADDRPGGLMRILEILKTHKLNIEYVYGFGEKSDGKAIFIFRITDIAKAIEVLKAGHLDYLPTETVEDSRKKASSWELIESL